MGWLLVRKYILKEDIRSQLIARSKTAQREKQDGKTRYQKRVKQKVASSVKNYNAIDMNELFKSGILTVGIDVIGETNNYVVTIKFGGILNHLQKRVKQNNGEFTLKVVIQSLVDSFNSDDVYIRCDCKDFYYRMGYYASVNNIIVGQKQTIPSKITNPNDKLGPGCKHVLCVLANTSWIIKVASVVTNYVKYMEKHRQQQYAKIIYPAIYDEKYEEPTQLNMFDDDNVETDKDTLNRANRKAVQRGQFQKDNPYRFKSKVSPNQLKMDDMIGDEEDE